MNLEIFLTLWAFLDLMDQWVPQEHKETPGQEDLKAERDSRGLQVSMGNLGFQEIQASPDLLPSKDPREEASWHRWHQGSMRRPL